MILGRQLVVTGATVARIVRDPAPPGLDATEFQPPDADVVLTTCRLPMTRSPKDFKRAQRQWCKGCRPRPQRGRCACTCSARQQLGAIGASCCTRRSIRSLARRRPGLPRQNVAVHRGAEGEMPTEADAHDPSRAVQHSCLAKKSSPVRASPPQRFITSSKSPALCWPTMRPAPIVATSSNSRRKSEPSTASGRCHLVISHSNRSASILASSASWAVLPPQRRRSPSISSSEPGQSPRNRRDSARSARSRPPVWQPAQ